MGANRPRRVDVRVLSATSRDLDTACAERQFRLDLFHRLNGVSFWLAPLRERVEEVSLLARHFLVQAGSPHSISCAGLERLILHPWPGNVRELRQAIRAAVVRARSRGSEQVDKQDLSPGRDEPGRDRPAPGAPTLADVVEALRRFDGNVSRAARTLGMHRAQLYRLLQTNRLSSDDFRRS